MGYIDSIKAEERRKMLAPYAPAEILEFLLEMQERCDVLEAKLVDATEGARKRHIRETARGIFAATGGPAHGMETVHIALCVKHATMLEDELEKL